MPCCRYWSRTRQSGYSLLLQLLLFHSATSFLLYPLSPLPILLLLLQQDPWISWISWVSWVSCISWTSHNGSLRFPRLLNSVLLSKIRKATILPINNYWRPMIPRTGVRIYNSRNLQYPPFFTRKINNMTWRCSPSCFRFRPLLLPFQYCGMPKPILKLSPLHLPTSF